MNEKEKILVGEVKIVNRSCYAGWPSLMVHSNRQHIYPVRDISKSYYVQVKDNVWDILTDIPKNVLGLVVIVVYRGEEEYMYRLPPDEKTEIEWLNLIGKRLAISNLRGIVHVSQ
jgi:hypothetical protein